ncbi:leucine-rich repeat-containing protein kinase family protein [Vibrio neptunius]|uniref:Serine/threonine-protein kinase n=1 Tax=Vibrio neptunius TaxID=170651 RepID=A0ABS3A492_9VIBR|nr:leucine-rich repeat-containing protein kinase family protein [Vibrio neptunius]MBN3492916.1 serine/threonine-protein kinase [Vibrio neptunius]MBN3515366.1 serine/threonine-protein kinase [Vibrio neptunius]MBN3549448.1 serine/threonine-protein kinase [Vibrio neptunius]MBN3577717.1 serine/threonine-protein kinase [Vibrio neptunius]MCH9871381.1 serine/threonine-protein kinase [Vibrio neptunius]
MHTVEQLRNGQLAGIQRLQLSEQLTELPQEILTLSDSLEILDVSNNLLCELPEWLTELTQLKIVFASNNRFTRLPLVLGQCERLEMVGFKSNQIVRVAEESLPEQLRWLILTDNQIKQLPESLGHRPRLQKLALAGNQITALPKSFKNLFNLELVRLSANQLDEFPQVLLELPKLAWMAFAGNPFCERLSHNESVPQISSASYSINHVLGQGASGVISHADWLDRDFDFPAEVAVKVFKGEITSDGYPQDELQACLQAGLHTNLVKSIAQVNEDDHLALVMELIPSDYFNLGLPPTLDTCTRDVFKPELTLSVEKIEYIVDQMLNVFSHLHDNKVCHGDLYAHNVLINRQGEMIFGDFGAASVYDYLTDAQQQGVRRVETRALSHFIEDLLSVCDHNDIGSTSYQRLSNMMRLAG